MNGIVDIVVDKNQIFQIRQMQIIEQIFNSVPPSTFPIQHKMTISRRYATTSSCL